MLEIGSIAYSSSYLAYGGAGGACYPRDSGAYSSQPFDTHASTLRALANGGSEIDRIAAALTKLRDALQATRNQSSFTAGNTDLRAIVTDVGQDVSRDSLSAAGINSGDSFTVQVGDGSIAILTFKSATQIHCRSRAPRKASCSTPPTAIGRPVWSLRSTASTMSALRSRAPAA